MIFNVVAAYNMLKTDSTIDSTSIYIAGHSFGGYLLPRIAKALPRLKGLIFLAANGRPLEDLLIEQTTYLSEMDTSKKSSKLMADSVKKQSALIKTLNKYDPDTSFIFHFPRSYWFDLNGYNYLQIVQELNQPMLFLQGGRDYQITEIDFNIWKDNVKGKNAEFKLYPDLNHFFIKGSGKSAPSEYNKGGNVDEQVIKDISSWILALKK